MYSNKDSFSIPKSPYSNKVHVQHNWHCFCAEYINASEMIEALESEDLEYAMMDSLAAMAAKGDFQLDNLDNSQ